MIIINCLTIMLASSFKCLPVNYVPIYCHTCRTLQQTSDSSILLTHRHPHKPRASSSPQRGIDSFGASSQCHQCREVFCALHTVHIAVSGVVSRTADLQTPPIPYESPTTNLSTSPLAYASASTPIKEALLMTLHRVAIAVVLTLLMQRLLVDTSQPTMHLTPNLIMKTLVYDTSLPL